MAVVSIMMWNWQSPEWPHFTWDARKLARAETLFVEGAGIVIGASRHLTPEEREGLKVEMMSHEAVDTSAIEGEQLDRDSVQSSIRRHLGLTADQRRPAPAEAGIAEMMVDLYGHVPDDLTEAMLHKWHRWVMNGRGDVKDVGQYRTHEDPMQIVSGAIHAPKVHFEAPPSDRMKVEMARFWEWLARTGPKGTEPIPATTRAGIAHIWFESIHPYEDGNGRLGRAISEKILAQGLSTPTITGMAGTLLKHRKAYYAALERAHSDLEITDWLLWFAAKVIEAQRRTLQQVEFILDKSRLLNQLRGKINARQEKALMRMFMAGPYGFVGGLSAANYMSITSAPTATATRDLVGLVSLGALTRTGEHKGTRYYLPMGALAVATLSAADVL